MRKRDKAFRPDRVGDYFRVEWLPLGLVTVSGLVYNVGLLAARSGAGDAAQHPHHPDAGAGDVYGAPL